VALSLSQSVPVAGAVLVTTPQMVSLADTRRAVSMYRKLNIPAIGLIENMSYFVCDQCGKRHQNNQKSHGPLLHAVKTMVHGVRSCIQAPRRELANADYVQGEQRKSHVSRRHS